MDFICPFNIEYSLERQTQTQPYPHLFERTADCEVSEETISSRFFFNPLGNDLSHVSRRRPLPNVDQRNRQLEETSPHEGTIQAFTPSQVYVRAIRPRSKRCVFVVKQLMASEAFETKCHGLSRPIHMVEEVVDDVSIVADGDRKWCPFKGD